MITILDEAQHIDAELQTELLAAGPLGHQPITKCDHGVYIPTGETTARHCSACNPDGMYERILRAAMARRKPPSRNYPEDSTLDAADYLALDAQDRIEQGRQWFAAE